MIAEDKFAGNKKTLRYLNKTLEKGCVSHAYILEGPEHVGKMTLALLFASELLGDSYENVLRNPDLLTVTAQEDKAEIEVDAIRELQKSLSLYPFKSKYKVAIIEKAELMNRTAANALLKTLEEPGKTSVLILVSSDMGKLLPTIKSRCQILNLNTAAREELEGFLMARGAGSDTSDILELSEGKAGMAIALAQNKDLLKSMRDNSRKILEFFDSNNFQKMEAAAAIGLMDKKEAAKILDIWTSALRRELLGALSAGKKERTAKLEAALVKTMSVKEDILSNNVNLKLAIENLCLGF